MTNKKYDILSRIKHAPPLYSESNSQKITIKKQRTTSYPQMIFPFFRLPRNSGIKKEFQKLWNLLFLFIYKANKL